MNDRASAMTSFINWSRNLSFEGGRKETKKKRKRRETKKKKLVIAVFGK